MFKLTSGVSIGTLYAFEPIGFPPCERQTTLTEESPLAVVNYHESTRFHLRDGSLSTLHTADSINNDYVETLVRKRVDRCDIFIEVMRSTIPQLGFGAQGSTVSSRYASDVDIRAHLLHPVGPLWL